MQIKASSLGLGFFPYFSLWVEGWFWIGWVMGFDWFECLLFFMIAGARNKLERTLLTLILTPLKPNTQSVCGLGCTLINPAQILLDHFLTQSSFLKACSQIGNLLLKLSIVFGSMEKLTLERDTYFTRRGQNSIATRMIKFVLKIFNLNGSSLHMLMESLITRSRASSSWAVGDKVGGAATLEAALRRSPPLLMEFVQCAELPRQQDDLIVGDALILLIRSCTQGR
jgi:hypothetical protein